MKVSDEKMKRTKALPAAAAAAATDGVDFGPDGPVGPIADNMDVFLSVGACPALVEAKTIEFTFEDSANGSDWSPLVGAPVFTVTGGTGNGAPSQEWRFYLPHNTRRHFRAKAAVESGGGNNTAVSYKLEFKV